MFFCAAVKNINCLCGFCVKTNKEIIYINVLYSSYFNVTITTRYLAHNKFRGSLKYYNDLWQFILKNIAIFFYPYILWLSYCRALKHYSLVIVTLISCLTRTMFHFTLITEFSTQGIIKLVLVAGFVGSRCCFIRCDVREYFIGTHIHRWKEPIYKLYYIIMRTYTLLFQHSGNRLLTLLNWCKRQNFTRISATPANPWQITSIINLIKFKSIYSCMWFFISV